MGFGCPQPPGTAASASAPWHGAEPWPQPAASLLPQDFAPCRGTAAAASSCRSRAAPASCEGTFPSLLRGGEPPAANTAPGGAQGERGRFGGGVGGAGGILESCGWRRGISAVPVVLGLVWQRGFLLKGWGFKQLWVKGERSLKLILSLLTSRGRAAASAQGAVAVSLFPPANELNSSRRSAPRARLCWK